jgi:hypothetical protein
MSKYLARQPGLRPDQKKASRTHRLVSTLTVSSVAGALFTSAVVLGQATKTADQPPGGVVKGTIDKAAVPQPAAVKKAAGKLVGAKNAVRVVNQGNRAPMIQQSKNQARPALRAELILVLKVCRLNTEEFRQINRAAQEMLDDVVSKVVDAQLNPRFNIPNGQRRPNIDGGKLLHDGFSAVVQKNLNHERWSKYEAERDKRDAYQKQCTLGYLIDAIDRELYLSAQQRTKVQESLYSHWDSGWQLYVDYLLFGNQFYPTNIDPLLNPILSDSQKKVWQNVQKVDGYWGFGGVWGNFGNDTDELAEELGEDKRKPVDHRKAMMKLQPPEKRN